MSDRSAFLEKRTSFLLILLSGLALVCRVICLGRKSLTGDESVTYLLAKADWHKFWQEISSHELNMLPYYTLVRGWIHLGTSEFMLRLLSALFAVTTVPLLYLLARRFFGRDVALVASLLLAVNTGSISYSQEARAYTMAMFVCVLAALFMLEALEPTSANNREMWGTIGFIAVAAFAVYVHFFSLFVLVAFEIALMTYPGIWLQWKRWLGAGLALALLIVPAVWYMKTHNVGQLDWIPPLSASTISKVPTLWAGSPAALVFYAVFWVVAVWLGWKQSERGSRKRWTYWFLLSWLCVPLAITLLLSLRHSVLMDRYMLISMPPAVLLAADGLWRLRRARVALLVVVVLISIGANARLYMRRSLHDGRSASQFVFQNAACGDSVVFVAASGSLPFQYYRDRTNLLRHCSESKGLRFRTVEEGVSTDSPNIWIVTMGPRLLSPEVQDEFERAKQLIPSTYALAAEHSYEAFRVMEYSRKANIE